MKQLLIFIAFVISIYAQAQISIGDHYVNGYHTHHFGYVPVNSFNTDSVVITNRSQKNVRMEYSNTWGSFDFTAHDTCFPGLQPGQSCWVNIRFWPLNPGYYTGDVRMQFSSESPYTPYNINIHLIGQAFRR